MGRQEPCWMLQLLLQMILRGQVIEGVPGCCCLLGAFPPPLPLPWPQVAQLPWPAQERSPPLFPHRPASSAAPPPSLPAAAAARPGQLEASSRFLPPLLLLLLLLLLGRVVVKAEEERSEKAVLCLLLLSRCRCRRPPCSCLRLCGVCV